MDILKKLLTMMRFRRPALVQGVAPAKESVGFGTFYGVFLPGILAIYGVILFLRLGWIVGIVGLPTTFAIISFAFLITLITSISIAAIATNMRVGTGGAYFIISRSFGRELGSSIGLALCAAKTLSVAFCVMGFAESLHTILPMIPVQALGMATLVAVGALVYVSSDAAIKAQFVIFLVIGVAFITLFCSNYTPSDTELMLQAPSPSGFWYAFAIFFPAATGIETAVAMSGDLKNPKRSLSIGTLAIVIVAYATYMAIAYFLANNIPRSTLASDPLIVLKFARIKTFVLLGVWAAALSSAIGSMMAAPRMMQAIAQDGVFPKFLAKGSGPLNEPKIASAVTFAFAMVAVYFGSLNAIAPFMTMFTLIAYGMVNVGAGIESFLSNPSWRPSVAVPAMIPLAGTVLCAIAMLMIDPGVAMLSLAVVFCVYIYLRRRNQHRSWDDLRTAILQYLCRFALYRLINAPSSPKSWRPNFLVFTRSPTKFNAIFKLVSCITRDRGFLTLASFVPETENDVGRPVRHWEKLVSAFLTKHHTTALVKLTHARDPSQQIRDLISSYGMGPIRPNTIVLGLPRSTQTIEAMLQNLAFAQEQKCNVLMIGESELISHNKLIDIWWDDNDRKSSEFMLLIALLLHRSGEWKKAKLNLKSYVTNEEGRSKREDYFRNFLHTNRLPMATEVIIIDESLPLNETILKHSTGADLIIRSLDGEAASLAERMDLAKHFPQVMFCKNAGHVEFTSIFT